MPPRITETISSVARMFLVASPRTSRRSARRPGAILPRSSSPNAFSPGTGRRRERFHRRQPGSYEQLDLAVKADAVCCPGVRDVGPGKDLDARLVESPDVLQRYLKRSEPLPFAACRSPQVIDRRGMEVAMETLIAGQVGAARTLPVGLHGGQCPDDECSPARRERDELPVGKLVMEDVSDTVASRLDRGAGAVPRGDMRYGEEAPRVRCVDRRR